LLRPLLLLRWRRLWLPWLLLVLLVLVLPRRRLPR